MAHGRCAYVPGTYLLLLSGFRSTKEPRLNMLFSGGKKTLLLFLHASWVMEVVHREIK